MSRRSSYRRCCPAGTTSASTFPATSPNRSISASPSLARWGRRRSWRERCCARLLEAGWRRDDQVVLVAAGTRDPRARGELRFTAASLSALVGHRVSIAFAAPCPDGSGYPSVRDAVAKARRSGARRVAVASYLLADGLFQSRLHLAGADVVSSPLGLHPAVIRLACRRRREAVLADAPASAARRAS